MNVLVNSGGVPALVSFPTARGTAGVSTSKVAAAVETLRIALLDSVWSFPSGAPPAATMAPFADGAGVFDTSLVLPSHGVLFLFNSDTLSTAERVRARVQTKGMW